MELTIQRDGITLKGKLDKPDVSRCPVAILFHGFLGNIEEPIHQIITKRLLEKNIAVVRFDFNGHGNSSGDLVNMDVLNEIEDAIAILKYVRNLDFVTEINIIGHSQGGVVGGILAGLYADVVSKLVLLAPAASLKDDANKGVCMGTSYDTNQIPNEISLNNNTIVIGGQYFRIAKFLPIYEVTENFRGRTLVIYGQNDSVVSMEAAVRYKECMYDCELEILRYLNHGIEGEDQEKVLDRVVEFLVG